MENPDLNIESYFYDLDPKFIATRPAEGRDSSKLLVYRAKSNELIHTTFRELTSFLSPSDTLVFNNTKVFPCRLIGKKNSGAVVEMFLLSLHPNTHHQYPVLIKSNGKKRIGDQFYFQDLIVTIKEKTESGEFLVGLNMPNENFLQFLEDHAKIPIPPYIRSGESDERDHFDYQTIYAQRSGSVAAPTAGLHFTEKIFEKLHEKNIQTAFVTLDVGLGTFRPVQVDNILEHHMHKESFEIEAGELEKINQAHSRIAVGTTTLRVLETCWDQDRVRLPSGSPPYNTDIFLYPGVEVNSIRGLITNFHLPKSTLLMLVSSLIGREKTLELYEKAKENNYRFFSYGDAMLILRDE